MAESMQGLRRSHRCAELSEADIGRKVTLMGWVQKRRNLGSLIFVDLRDRSGLMQILFDENIVGSEGFAAAGSVRSEYVLAVTGRVQKREAAVNENLKTGSIELAAQDIRILSESEVPPFPIEDGIKTRDELRLKYRYLDLRRPEMQKKLILRSKVTSLIRKYMTEDGFLEIETPMLQKSTPEGARDYLVPSRVHPGSFYALPQSPQLFKQLLMVSGFDRYFQLARCFRDEDLRADRQPEFTQVDLEMSFVDMEDVLEATSKLLRNVFRDAIGVEVPDPIPRLTWQEAMDRFGSDKPDTRFGMELVNVSDVLSGCEFAVFQSALASGGTVRGINVKGQGDMGRKKIDKLVDLARACGAKGLAYIQCKSDGTVKSSFSKFLREEEMNALLEAMDAKAGDLLLFTADRFKTAVEVLGQIRLTLARDLDLIPKDQFHFLWVVDFPAFEWSDEQSRFLAMHHPFTMPYEEDLDKLESGDLGSIRSKAYDIVLNGVELGGGSIRIHQDQVQERMFKALGFTIEEARDRFGFLLTAFEYGVPPHAGLAFGLDRMIMLMTGAESIRDVIAFPKVKDASDLMTQAPLPVDGKQLEELSLETLAIEGEEEKDEEKDEEEA